MNLKLSDFDQLGDDKRIKFKVEDVDGSKFTIVSYMIADADLWQKPFALETRGVTFNEDGQCVSRPFEKFFSIGENKDTQLDIIERVGVQHVFEKRDGSMITPVLVGNNKIRLKTKKSFFSDVANLANEMMNDNLHNFCDYLLTKCPESLTPIFEFTVPENRVVIDYGRSQPFTVLAIRKTVSGEYIHHDIVKTIAEQFSIPVVEEFFLSVPDIFDICKTKTDFEGFVLLLRDGTRVKIKTDWYIRNHKIKTNLRVRDVAEMVVKETIDELKTVVSAEGLDLAPVLEIEKSVVKELSGIRNYVESIVDNIPIDATAKEIATSHLKNDPFFNAIMCVWRGKEPDYIRIWEKMFLSNYSLDSIYNWNF